jgi:hypothetical protein
MSHFISVSTLLLCCKWSWISFIQRLILIILTCKIHFPKHCYNMSVFIFWAVMLCELVPRYQCVRVTLVYLKVHMVLLPRRPTLTSSLPWESHISQTIIILLFAKCLEQVIDKLLRSKKLLLNLQAEDSSHWQGCVIVKKNAFR